MLRANVLRTGMLCMSVLRKVELRKIVLRTQSRYKGKGKYMETYSDIKALSFREAMAELDAVVTALESSTLELEESLKAYERGVALIADLQARLANAQQVIDVRMGELEAVPSDEQIDSTLSKA